MWQALQAAGEHQQTAALQRRSCAGPGQGELQQAAAAKRQKLRGRASRAVTGQLTRPQAPTTRTHPAKVGAYRVLLHLIFHEHIHRHSPGV